MRNAHKVSWSLIVLLALSGACTTPEVSSGGRPGGGGSSGSPGGNDPGNPRAGDTRVPAINLPEVGSSPTPDAAAAQCASEAHKAEQVPLDLLLLLDTSGSMNTNAGMRSKWVTAQTALRAFVSDPRSGGLGVGMQFFPQDKPCASANDCQLGGLFGFGACESQRICAGPGGPAGDATGCSNSGGGIVIGPTPRAGTCAMGTTCQAAGRCATSNAFCTTLGQECPMGGGPCTATPKFCTFTDPEVECQTGLYEKPAVSISALPTGQAELVRTLMAKQPNGGTPMGPAVTGVLKHLREHLAANPGRKAVMILASDGLPSACTDQDDVPGIEANLRAAFTQAPAITTYVIGVFAPRELAGAKPTLDRLAMAGGSTEAIVLTATDDLTQRLQDALNQIRGAALACEYKIPAAMAGRQLDFGKVNLRYTSGATQESLPYVERADRCDPARGGWYYDVSPATGTPTKVVVCAATCQRFKADQQAQVDLVFGCATETIR